MLNASASPAGPLCFKPDEEMSGHRGSFRTKLLSICLDKKWFLPVPRIKLFLLGKIRLIRKDLVSIKLFWLLLCTFFIFKVLAKLFDFLFSPKEGNQVYNSRANIHMYKLISQMEKLPTG